MRLSELAYETISPDPQIDGLTADSRAVSRGFLFAALEGVKSDGADFIPQAEENGAAAILARPGVRSTLPVIEDPEPRRRLAQMAARFYPRQPEVVAGITGTNGKTSTARFAAQLWTLLGYEAGSMGTLGAQSRVYERPLAHTTPEPVTLHETLDAMARAGVTHLAMEASSHALAQHRPDAVNFRVAAFTNITQDHLDYHASFDDYFAAKGRLFSQLLTTSGTAAINMDGEGAQGVVEIARARNLPTIQTGVKGRDVKLLSCKPHLGGLALEIECNGYVYRADPPLIGAFQAENALLAAGIVIAAGAKPYDVMLQLDNLEGAPGRMEYITEVWGGGVYVDYAHTPDAVATALAAIRAHAPGKVIAIIGAGGDRDRTKRPLMGEAAAKYADTVIVADDNPRTEDPAAIRAELMKGCPDAKNIGDRAEAIATGVAMLSEGDVLLILGKGHEAGQQVGDEIFPFDDASVARDAASDRMKELG
ncbi:UDP-N-acetylmuramoyl-L-alanyl-D-glutamate--2,6-diaminopimelate ligase [Hyphococcus luteus]|uniref:UDP-N-acetylmuramoyl-L-alanyl-D-glutamate--2,6-diaminopimelate ligase n=1 Tax=Hyphococcus luteus TaxID=2058213 RepID=A0A2S7K9B2_9PROT|nr:UDP-N-acetylmuramoyl-L-alanyl-D-glutamate--2,6-diaminopimelate ligase [Marinicaulis flavus]PQA89090.1 UDP-N-acetylmuramoyl-L-alanyl-D-glutamate--2,6-diaminopimelate ligase [Marinicaulis flavus]